MNLHKASRINQKIDKLIKRATEASRPDQYDHNSKIQAEMRLKFINELALIDRGRTRLIERPSVFISYSRNTGVRYFEKACEACERVGFMVKTGFDETGKGNVLGAVLGSIKESTVYLGIFTPEYTIMDSTNPTVKQAAPSVWLLAEEGIAIGLGKPFRLLVDDGIHKDFWWKVMPEKVQTIFNGANYQQKLEEAVLALVRRYQEKLALAVGNTNLFDG
jgi:hypothetical protein